jgi:hypothetical protein
MRIDELIVPRDKRPANMFRLGAAPVAPKRHRIGKCFAAHATILAAHQQRVAGVNQIIDHASLGLKLRTSREETAPSN